MANLTIRDVPDDVRSALAAEARSRGQSLQSYLLGVLRRQADFIWNVDLLAEVGEELAHTPGVGESAPRAAEVLARARAGEDDAGPTRGRRAASGSRSRRR